MTNTPPIKQAGKNLMKKKFDSIDFLYAIFVGWVISGHYNSWWIALIAVAYIIYIFIFQPHYDL